MDTRKKLIDCENTLKTEFEKFKKWHDRDTGYCTNEVQTSLEGIRNSLGEVYLLIKKLVRSAAAGGCFSFKPISEDSNMIDYEYSELLPLTEWTDGNVFVRHISNSETFWIFFAFGVK